MKIVDVKATYIPLPLVDFRPAWAPGAVYKRLGATLVQVFTDEGIIGIAGGHAHGGEEYDVNLRGLRYDNFGQLINIEQKIKPFMIGKSPFEIERHHKVLLNASIFGDRIWFVETALWDIIGKACGQPIYKLWGGFSDRVKVYASTGEIKPPEQRVKEVEGLLEQGFKAVKLRFHSRRVEDDFQILEAIRDAVGDKLDIMVDANQYFANPSQTEGPVWDYKTALKVARKLEDYKVFWLEEPLPMGNLDILADLRMKTDIMIAGGETNQYIHEFREMIERRSYDILQPDPCYSEGLFQLRKIAAMAEANNILLTPHGWGNGLTLAANLQLAASIPNCTYLECPFDPPSFPLDSFNMVLKDPLIIREDGYIRLPRGSGLGVELNEEILNKYGRTIESYGSSYA